MRWQSLVLSLASGALTVLPTHARGTPARRAPRLTLTLLSTPTVGAKFKLLASVNATHPRALGVFTDSDACPPAALDMPSQSNYSGGITTSPQPRFHQSYTIGPLTPNSTLYICAYLTKINNNHTVGATLATEFITLRSGTNGRAHVTRHST